jgi:hypothetical protein
MIVPTNRHYYEQLLLFRLTPTSTETQRNGKLVVILGLDSSLIFCTYVPFHKLVGRKKEVTEKCLELYNRQLSIWA